MRIRWRNFELPARVAADAETASATYGRFVVEPFEKGFAHTIGNGLRRVLLSSIEGYGITHVKIENVLHEFSTIEGVLEDVVEVILNIKGVLLRLNTEGPIQLRLDVKRKGPVVARDIQCPNDAEVLNPDHLICTLTSEREFRMDLEARKGRGYLSAEENEKEEKEVGVIAIDTNFSPVVRVRYKVEDTRVGKITNYDKLVLEVWTDGSVTPESALVEAAKIYRKHLNPFVHYLQPAGSIMATEDQDPMEVRVQRPDESSVLDQPVTALDLSVRARNCLDAENIRSLRQLVGMTEADLLELRNFGQTSLNEVVKKLAGLGLVLSGPQSPVIEVSSSVDESPRGEPSSGEEVP